MPNIDTLIRDIDEFMQDVTSNTSKEEYTDEKLHDLAGKGVGDALARSLKTREQRDQLGDKVLYASGYGKPCLRQQWYALRPGVLKTPQESIGPSALRKFAYGDILEEYVLFLAEAAGHEVTDRQAVVEVPLKNGWKLRGRQDARIDGELVDVKSASSYSYKKIVERGLLDEGNDAFGYLPQLSTYLTIDDNRAHFLAIDKTLGHLGLGTYSATELPSAVKLGNRAVDAVTAPVPPARAFSDKPDGAKGNRKLDTACSYCPFKRECWPGLRTFAYSNGPKFLTRVVSTPNVMEVRDDV